jgi:hypothetical protein
MKEFDIFVNKEDNGNEDFKPSIRIGLPDDLIPSSGLDFVFIHHANNSQALSKSTSMAYNVIIIDDANSIIPNDKTFSPDDKDTHHDLLETLIMMASSNKTTLVYEKDDTLKFLSSYNAAEQMNGDK